MYCPMTNLPLQLWSQVVICECVIKFSMQQ